MRTPAPPMMAMTTAVMSGRASSDPLFNFMHKGREEGNHVVVGATEPGGQIGGDSTRDGKAGRGVRVSKMEEAVALDDDDLAVALRGNRGRAPVRVEKAEFAKEVVLLMGEEGHGVAIVSGRSLSTRTCPCMRTNIASPSDPSSTIAWPLATCSTRHTPDRLSMAEGSRPAKSGDVLRCSAIRPWSWRLDLMTERRMRRPPPQDDGQRPLSDQVVVRGIQDRPVRNHGLDPLQVVDEGAHESISGIK